MPPCKKDCPNRNAECHANCKAYAEYRALCDEDIKARLERQLLGNNPQISKRMREQLMRQKRGRK